MSGWAQRQAEAHEENEAYRDGLESRVSELEAIVARQGDMLHNMASEAGFVAGEAYTWISIVNRLRQQGRNG